MRLKPELPADEIYKLLSLSATFTWGVVEAASLETNLRGLAQAMAVIGAAEIPDDTQPLFGGDDPLGFEDLA